MTSPEVGPLFADTLATAIDRAWARAGRPAPFTVVDAGTGPGTLTAGLSRAAQRTRPPDRSIGAVVGVDRGESERAEGDDHLADVELAGTIVVANELLDNLPFRIVERTDDGWAEVWVATTDNGPVEQLEPLGPGSVPLDDAVAAGVAVGARVPVHRRAATWVTETLAAGPASLVVFDYGTLTTAELAARGGWLRTYRDHQRGDDPYQAPGSFDITADVALDQLPTPDRVETQAEFLRRAGIDQLVTEGRAHWAANAAQPDLEAIRMRSRVTEAGALLDEDGLGGWLVCSWGLLAEA